MDNPLKMFGQKQEELAGELSHPQGTIPLNTAVKPDQDIAP